MDVKEYYELLIDMELEHIALHYRITEVCDLYRKQPLICTMLIYITKVMQQSYTTMYKTKFYVCLTCSLHTAYTPGCLQQTKC